MSDNITFSFAEPSNKPSQDSIQNNGLTGTDIITKIRAINAATPLHIALLTPCYGSQCYVNYVIALMNTMSLCSSIGVKMKIEFCRNDSLVSRARNNLIAKAMGDPTVTHMLFIDADITWSPIDIFKLVLSDKSIVGGIYPIKN